MKVTQKFILVLCSGLLLVPAIGRAGFVPGDATSMRDAVHLATNVYPNKLILLLVDATNSCSACRALLASGLPCTNPPVRQVLNESYVYYPCGPDEGCTEYQTWTGSGSIPVPLIMMFDPLKTGTSLGVNVGYQGAVVLSQMLNRGVFKYRPPYVTRLENQTNAANGLDITITNWNEIGTIDFNNIRVKCQSGSTNVPIWKVNFCVDTNAWSSLVVANQTAWNLDLPQAQIVSGTHVLQFYGLDKSSTTTRTNVFTFIYNPNVVVQNPTTTTVVSSLNPSIYGQTVNFTANVTSGSSPVTEGTITFMDGATTLGTRTPDASGAATLPTSTLSATLHPITAVYGGSSNFAGSTNAVYYQTVNKADPIVTDWPTASAITYGQTLASSTLSGGSATPAGVFDFTTPSTVPAMTAPQSVTYTPTDTKNYNTASNSVSVSVIVELSQLNQVFANYWSANTNVNMTNPVALCNGFFQFSLTNISGWNLNVYVSTNLTNWTPLTNAAPVYQFEDPGATTGSVTRFYRLGH